MAIIRPEVAVPVIVTGKYLTSFLRAAIEVGKGAPDTALIQLTVDEQFFEKQDLIEFRDLLNEFIEALK